MTSPIETNNVVERLRRKRCVLHDADRLHSTLELVNPDGPEAGELIQSLSDRIDVLEGEPTDAMIDAGKGAWLDKRGFSDRDVLTAIYEAMTRASLGVCNAKP